MNKYQEYNFLSNNGVKMLFENWINKDIKKVLLVEPNFPIPNKSRNHSNFLPIGLLKIASYLRTKSIDVKLIRYKHDSSIQSTLDDQMLEYKKWYEEHDHSDEFQFTAPKYLSILSHPKMKHFSVDFKSKGEIELYLVVDPDLEGRSIYAVVMSGVLSCAVIRIPAGA